MTRISVSSRNTLLIDQKNYFEFLNKKEKKIFTTASTLYLQAVPEDLRYRHVQIHHLLVHLALLLLPIRWIQTFFTMLTLFAQ